MNTLNSVSRIYPHVHNSRYFNYPGEKKESVLWRSSAMYCASLVTQWGSAKILERWNAFDAHVSHMLPGESPFARITWIGHATFLITVGKMNILTDPVFGDLTILFRRLINPGIALTQLPRIDAVVISHNHRDHLEKTTVQWLAQQNPACVFFVPQNDKQWLNSWGIENVVECNWWDMHSLTASENTFPVNFYFLPARHWSQRSFFDRNRSLWGSWMIEYQGKQCYFAGDTSYGEHFTSIACEFTEIETVLMPIGPCEPKAWMKNSHLDAAHAGRAFLDLQARSFIPMHWGTYGFGTDSPLIPIDRITAWWQDGVLESNLYALKIGQSVTL